MNSTVPRVDGGPGHRFADHGRHAGGRGLLDYLLVAALGRAIALIQMHRVAVAVAEHLHLDMARVQDVFLDQYMVVAETGGGLGARRGEGLGEVPCPVYAAHTLAAATRTGLDKDRVADGPGLIGEESGVLVFTVITGGDGNTRFLHQCLRGVLQAHGADGAGGRADESEASGGDRIGEARVLGQETVAGVDRLRAGASTCWARASASECTATVPMPIRRAVRAMRQAISPRLAMRILVNMSAIQGREGALVTLGAGRV
jgi:hypothetical protein